MITINSAAFNRDMDNIINYAIGYLEGVKAGKKTFLDSLGASAIETLKQYIDTNARMSPEMLHHIYEWNQVGSPAARLFDITYTVSNLGLSLKSSFSQSSSIKNGSKVPFYDKARIMENGIPVTIKPRAASVLAFEVDGEQVFTKNPVEVESPGGPATEGGFEKAFDSFFNNYFSQSFLRSSGIAQYLESPTLFKKNLAAGKRGGKAVGYNTGFRWIANAGLVR